MVSHPDSEPDDEALIRQILLGDDGAFQLIIERYQNLVWSLLNRMVTDADDREELAQDIFLKVYFKLKQFRFESKFSTWLYTIAYRAALSYLRKTKPQLEPLDDHEEAVEEDWSLEGAIAGEQVKRAMDQLGLEDRTVLTLYHLHQCTVDEIATITDKPDGTIKNQLFRARKKLKTILQQELRQ